MRFNIIIISVLILLISSCSAKKYAVSENMSCNTKYPIILVHGIAYRDDVKLLPYWSKIPEKIEEFGGEVFLSNTNAFNSHIDNAVILKSRINEILELNGAEKVNIIAHSKGGLESRYMISKLRMADKVASLTTMASPHRGSYIADTILISLEKREMLNNFNSFLQFYARFIGDINPKPILATKNLTVAYMKHFNKSVIDSEKVYYQSYGGIISDDYPLKYLRLSHKILKEKDGKNDSQVSETSCKWGNFRGFVEADDFGISHFDIAGMRFISKATTLDAEMFYIEIVKDLKIRGF